MSTSVEEKLAETVKALAPEKQEEVLRFAETLANQSERRRLSILEKIDAITAEVPDEAWDELPNDGSLNLDHYLYGAPKR